MHQATEMRISLNHFTIYRDGGRERLGAMWVGAPLVNETLWVRTQCIVCYGGRKYIECNKRMSGVNVLNIPVKTLCNLIVASDKKIIWGNTWFAEPLNVSRPLQWQRGTFVGSWE